MKINPYKITRFDRSTCGTLDRAVEQAVQSVAQKYGISIKRKSGSYTDSIFTMRLEAAVMSKGGVAFSQEAETFKANCDMYNLIPSDLGRTFKSEDGDMFEVTGLSVRASKHPIIGKNLSNGKSYRLSARMVQRGLGRKLSPLTMPNW